MYSAQILILAPTSSDWNSHIKKRLKLCMQKIPRQTFGPFVKAKAKKEEKYLSSPTFMQDFHPRLCEREEKPFFAEQSPKGVSLKQKNEPMTAVSL